MANEDKARENRLRQAARRQGLELVRSRTRDSRATDYGLYRLVKVEVVQDAATLDAVEAYLSR